LLAGDRVVQARDKAVELLARRAHSLGELRQKLLRRAFDSRSVEEALTLLSERGYLDDRGFARQWVEQRLERHPEGQPALAAGLRRRGLSREIVEEVLADSCPPEIQRRSAAVLLERLSRRAMAAGRSPDRDELRRVLQRRGFPSSLVLELLRGSFWEGRGVSGQAGESKDAGAVGPDGEYGSG